MNLNVDPGTNLPTDCAHDIFNHLGGKDLLKCTLVCPEWNRVIGTTRSCMMKIKFNITEKVYDPSYVHRTENVLMHSTRRYRCFQLFDCYDKKFENLMSMIGRHGSFGNQTSFKAIRTNNLPIQCTWIQQASFVELKLKCNLVESHDIARLSFLRLSEFKLP